MSCQPQLPQNTKVIGSLFMINEMVIVNTVITNELIILSLLYGVKANKICIIKISMCEGGGSL